MRKTGDHPPSSPSEETSIPQIRDVHTQLPGLRIAPLRQPVSRRLWNTPFPHKPEVSARSAAAAAVTNGSLPTPTAGLQLPEKLPTLEEFVNAARTSDSDLGDNYLNPNTSQPPRTILPDFINLQTVEKLPYLFEDNNASKRRRIDLLNDNYSSEHLQLPVPQTQNEKKPPPFGPFAILNGLNEPPPNAALFPPIEPGSLPPILTRPPTDSELAVFEKQAEKQADKRELRLEEILDPNSLDRSNAGFADEPNLEQPSTIDYNQTASHPPVDHVEDSEEAPVIADAPLSPKTRGRSRRNLRRWTEQETTDLLKGVVKCGIGNWTAILQQPELKFNKRSAANLKDRFRVCCPWAYGAADPNEATKQIQDTLANALMNAESLTSGAGGKILLPDPRPKDSNTTTSTEVAESASTKLGEQLLTPSSQSKQPRPPTPAPAPALESPQSSLPTKGAPTQSTKSKSTLSSLGIPEPYFTIKSKRRSRRPFTPAEDEALLKGYAVHGFQWTLIQQDKHLNLSHRRATDLRDRFRTKFPNAYREGGSVSGGSIVSVQRENSNENTPTLGNNMHAGAVTSPSKKSKNPPQSISLPPPLVLAPALGSAASLDKKRNPLSSDSTNLTSISSLLPPLPPLNHSGMAPDSSTAGIGGQNLASSTLALSSSSGIGNHNTSFTSVSSAGSAAPSSWEDNTLPPFNWNDIN